MDEGRNMPKERKPASVSGTKQAGETCSRWEWVEPTVWTDRMLKALETGVKGLFPRARAALSNRSPRLGYSILSEVSTTNWRARSGRTGRRVRREGRRVNNRSSLPLACNALHGSCFLVRM